MIKISQTDYIDFISKSGMSKLSKVKTIYNRPEYHPAFDFYKPLREEIIDFIKFNKSKNDFLDFISIQNPKKQLRFSCLMDGYLKFLGRKKAVWFEPPVSYWSYKTLSIRMNPELGIILNGEKYIVKLYFKDDPLEKGDIKILLWMMNNTLASGIYTGYNCALLDLNRSKLHYLKKEDPTIESLVEGEAESFIKIWESLNKKSA